MIPYDNDDRRNAALCAWKEARGEGADGMKACLHIQANRVGAKDFPTTLHGVIFQKHAFSSMTISSDPEFNLEPSAGDVQFLYCMSIVDDVLNGNDPDITKGAHYYENPLTATSDWFKRVIVDDPINHAFTVKIGKQNFYV